MGVGKVSGTLDKSVVVKPCNPEPRGWIVRKE